MNPRNQIAWFLFMPPSCYCQQSVYWALSGLSLARHYQRKMLMQPKIIPQHSFQNHPVVGILFNMDTLCKQRLPAWLAQGLCWSIRRGTITSSSHHAASALLQSWDHHEASFFCLFQAEQMKHDGFETLGLTTLARIRHSVLSEETQGWCLLPHSCPRLSSSWVSSWATLSPATLSFVLGCCRLCRHHPAQALTQLHPCALVEILAKSPEAPAILS